MRQAGRVVRCDEESHAILEAYRRWLEERKFADGNFARVSLADAIRDLLVRKAKELMVGDGGPRDASQRPQDRPQPPKGPVSRAEHRPKSQAGHEAVEGATFETEQFCADSASQELT